MTRLHGQVQRISSQGGTVDTVLSDLFEDVHWILLITGNVIALDVDGETALIPSEIMQHSIAQASSVNIPVCLEVLASPGRPASEIPGYESSDHVIRLLGDVFRLTEVSSASLVSQYF